MDDSICKCYNWVKYYNYEFYVTPWYLIIKNLRGALANTFGFNLLN